MANRGRAAGDATRRGRLHRSEAASVERRVELPLPSALKKGRVPRGRSVALVEVEGERLKLSFLRPSTLEDERSTLSESEEAVLARGGAEPASGEELRLAVAQAATDYEHLRATSLTVDQAAKRLGVNPSRVRQRLLERSLYGMKERNAWLLPVFQFQARGLVPGIEVVLERLPSDLSPLAVARWFSSPNPDLCSRDDDERALTPLQWLRRANPAAPAAELAAAL